MRVILHSWCQIKRTSSSLRYVTCGPGHIQRIFRTAYLGFNIQLKVGPRQFEVSERFNSRYTANFEPNTAHMLRFTLCELWSRTYTIHLQLRTFRLLYSSERICAAIGNISTIQCSLYCKLGAKYSAHPPVYAMWTVVPDIYNKFTAPHIETWIFIWTYLRCYWKYLDNSMRVILHSWCQIQSLSTGLRYVNRGPGHIPCIYSSAYSDFNVQLNISALLLEISRQVIARYNADWVPYIAHTLQFTLCEPWFQPYTM
jgi:hypothetical protein